MTRNNQRATWFRFYLAAALGLQAMVAAYSASPGISVTPTALSFHYQIGAALPAAQTLQIKSSGANFNVSIAIAGPAPYQAQWLSVSAAAGTTPASIKVYVNPTGLPAGTFQGTMTLTASGAGNSPLSVPVTLAVGDAPATLSASPSSVDFDSSTGVFSQTVMLASSGGPLTAAVKVSGATWLKVIPTGSIALVGVPCPITITVDVTGLAPNSYSGKLTVSSTTAANKSLDIVVNLVVKAGTPAITATWPAGLGIRTAGATAPAPVVTVSGTNFYNTSTVAVNGTAVVSTVLSATSIQATIPNELLTAAGNLSLTVTTPPPGGGTSTAFKLPVWPTGPNILAIVNVASYDAAAISPGEIVDIYGTGLGPDDLNVASLQGSTIPTSWPAAGNATSVTVDGNAAPLLYTSATQLSCIVPYAVAAKAGQTVDVVVTYGANKSAAKAMTVAAVHPGVFTLDASGSGQGAILIYNTTTTDYTINSSSNAATKGNTIMLYVTGFGQTSPAGQETKLITGTVSPVAVPTVTIDGQAATVQGSAAPVGSVPGVLQINATVPAIAKANNAAQVVVTLGGVTTPTVTMAVK